MSDEQENCIICGRKCEVEQSVGDVNKRKLFDCEYCGKFYEMDSLRQFLYRCNSDEYEEKYDESKLYKVSSWIRDRNENWNITPELDYEKFEEVLNSKDKKIKEKFDLFMLFLQKAPNNIDFINDCEKFMDNMGLIIDTEQLELCQDIIIKCWCKDYKELKQIFQKALELNYIQGKITHDTHFSYTNITFDGFEYIEQLEEPNKNSKKIFVAFNFSDDLKSIFNTQVKEAIEETGFIHKIVNQETTPHDQKITDEIVSQIKSSRMIIADFTNSSTNVYFEAGFAMGMKIPVIWTCKEGHKFSFDTGQFPHITWKDGEDLKEQLVNRIQAIM